MRSLLIMLLALTLVACNLSMPANGANSDAPTAVPLTQIVMPTAYVAYWQMIPIAENRPDERNFLFFDQIVLTRVETATPVSDNLESDLQFALGALTMSEHLWQSTDLVLERATVTDGLATVAFTGTITAVGGAILGLIPEQIQLTIFQFDDIQQTTITLNG
ncbi:MAG: hypothetical protein WBC91_03915, partial [Phototrophicaceae bacterium]